MQQYVSRCDVSVDGAAIADIKNFKVLGLSKRAIVKLMNKRGFIKKTLDHAFSFDYVIPAAAAIDWEDDKWENVPVLAAKDGGGKYDFSGCCVLDISEETYDGENEAVVTVTWGAEKKNKG